MGVIETIAAFNHAANDALDNSESRINVLSHYKIDGRTYIRVDDQSREYKLINGEWQELPPF